MYALADCNNFFVSCERVFRPDLWNKPVVVLSGNDGCVVSRSNEVKALGIPMGVPLYQIRDKVEKYGITCFSSNFSLYSDMSDRVMSLLRKHTTRFEQYSIDEGYIHIDHISPERQKTYCEQIVREIYQGTGIPISMGIAPTKTLAKVASKYAKKHKGYHGACLIDTEERRRKALEMFAVSDVWGVGRQARTKLFAAGITTALQFADCREEFARNLLHKPGLLTWRELNGIDCIDLGEMAQKQSITRSRTFASAVTELAVLEQQITDFCSSCARHLRVQQSVCRQLTVYAATSRFRTDSVSHTIWADISLPVATSNTGELIEYALRALREQFQAGAPYKRAGIILTHILPAAHALPDLFDTRDRQKDERLQLSLDRMNDRFGKYTIQYATATMPAANADASVYKREHCSPLYTTDIRQIVQVSA